MGQAYREHHRRSGTCPDNRTDADDDTDADISADNTAVDDAAAADDDDNIGALAVGKAAGAYGLRAHGS